LCHGILGPQPKLWVKLDEDDDYELSEVVVCRALLELANINNNNKESMSRLHGYCCSIDIDEEDDVLAANELKAVSIRAGTLSLEHLPSQVRVKTAKELVQWYVSLQPQTTTTTTAAATIAKLTSAAYGHRAAKSISMLIECNASPWLLQRFNKIPHHQGPWNLAMAHYAINSSKSHVLKLANMAWQAGNSDDVAAAEAEWQRIKQSKAYEDYCAVVPKDHNALRVAMTTTP
jgi:hypothetical protein